MGAGSTVFVKNVLGDVMMCDALCECEIALYDIDGERLEESYLLIDTLNKNVNSGRAKITKHLGVSARKDALRGASFVVNAIQVGGYEPSTAIDFEIPKKIRSAPDEIVAMCGEMAEAHAKSGFPIF